MLMRRQRDLDLAALHWWSRLQWLKQSNEAPGLAKKEKPPQGGKIVKYFKTGQV